MNTPERFAGSAEALHEAASGGVGLHDFGPSKEYLPGLERLLEALDNDGPRFAPGCREAVKGALVGLLVTRLFAERGFKERPDALSRPIVRPLIITGVPRTGTTALHKLLSMDDQFQGLERWLTVFPMPRPPREQWAQHPLYRSVVDGLEAFFQSAPQMRAAHNMVADDIDECLEVLKQNFCSNNFGSTYRVPAYDRWWIGQSELASYQRLGRIVRLVGADDDRPWLLKNPGHIKELDTLLQVFPDACVVQTHRDPARALPSLCSVLQMARAIVEAGNVQPIEIGARELENWSRASDAAMAARERLPARQFLDVRHKDFHADPMGVVQGIYDHFGFALSAPAAERMRQRIRANPEGQFGEHRYTPEEFGLHPQQIRERFAAYMERYGLA
jgi:hypothetical protein